jgi:hypothetical protein
MDRQTRYRLRRDILASKERQRMYTWSGSGYFVCGFTLLLLLIANRVGWVYALGPIAAVGAVGFIVCLALTVRHLIASFTVRPPRDGSDEL